MSHPVETLLGFDFGEKRVGVAVGNTLTGAARPLTTIADATVDGRFLKIEALLKEWQPSLLVVGRPLHPDGTPHEITALAEKFARRLEGRFGLPVVLVDERYSTAAARERLAASGGGYAGGRHGRGGAGRGGPDGRADADDDFYGAAAGGRGAGRGGRSRGGRGASSADGDDAAAAAVILEQYLGGGS
ncbi:MAG: Holliday junction resolvase RuvX [Lautropia sp.]|nr:Holliday junction resolvase RuvX [Lautropia sp.]